MIVFNTFFKLLAKNKWSIIINLVVFLGLSSIAVQNGSPEDQINFKDIKLKLSVIDRDHSATSMELKNYIGELHILTELEDDPEVFQDELFFNTVYEIIIIPAGFEENLIAGKDLPLETLEAPDAGVTALSNIQFEQIMKYLKTYLAIGYTPSDAMLKTKDIMQTNAPVSLQLDNHSLEEAPRCNYYFQYLPYPMVAILVSCISLILILFNQKDIKNRTVCASFSLKKRNFELSLANIIVAIIIWVILMLFPFILVGADMIHSGVYGFYLLNSFTFLIVSFSISYLIGIFSNSVETIAIFSNSVSLGLCFLGGVFVPQSVMSKQILYISKFLPSYWYVITNKIIGKNTKLVGSVLKDVIFGILIQFCFAIAIFGISLVITKRKTQAC
ncbi:ABC transporter permease [Lachnoclostridium phytofermentans]|uniref:ABC-2 type transporter n=1 Tax=Lachnoclostridium phytofermentans (strain ATCC 700394 / DSM 18823 / ISDg) TaxID=357809 RepID=A9KNA2_LACP7|nr:ABC transporter permease [Lachnoclostridium phytofermentans]ABX41601.1 ABC-2 type transporter [Lachnoclostridium phytofermentans ISDg]